VTEPIEVREPFGLMLNSSTIPFAPVCTYRNRPQDRLHSRSFTTRVGRPLRPLLVQATPPSSWLAAPHASTS
jgi:hypothetical protein